VVVSVATRCVGQETYDTSVGIDCAEGSNSRLGTRQNGDLDNQLRGDDSMNERHTSWDCRAGSVMVARVAAETVIDVAAP
jgi:hypothetical protein